LKTPTLRRAELADARTLQTLLEEHVHHHGEILERGVQALETYGFGPKALFRTILAERDGAALGFALFYPDFSTLRGRPGVLLQDIYVRPDARGLGLGRKLLAQVLQDAQDWDAAFLTLMVDRSNDVAQAFYAKLGFTGRGDYDLLILEGDGLTALQDA
jgi:ribosomal protein S18 acetylase RimI-like enzyme